MTESRQTRWQKERIARGLCRSCGKPRGAKRKKQTLCQPCADQAKARVTLARHPPNGKANEGDTTCA